MKTIEDIKRDWQDGLYNPDNRKYKLHPVRDCHIFDENLSVKENRRLVDEYNAQVKVDRAARQQEIIRLDAMFHNDIVEYIVATYHLNKAQASAIEQRVYIEKHSCMTDYFVEIDDMCDFVENLITL